MDISIIGVETMFFYKKDEKKFRIANVIVILETLPKILVSLKKVCVFNRLKRLPVCRSAISIVVG